MQAKSCHNCANLSHIKETIRGNEPVCSYPPRNFDEENYRYVDIADICDDYEKIGNETA